MENVQIKENERIDDLQIKDYRIIQKTDGFCFGIDAVLLSDYARVKKKISKKVLYSILEPLHAIEDVAKELGISVLGKLPMDQKFAKAADAGEIYAVENDYLTEAKTVLENLR